MTSILTGATPGLRRRSQLDRRRGDAAVVLGAATRDEPLAAVVLLGFAGAVIGDRVVYWVGRLASEPWCRGSSARSGSAGWSRSWIVGLA